MARRACDSHNLHRQGELVIGTAQPISIVENKLFLRFVKKVYLFARTMMSGELKLPSRREFSRHLFGEDGKPGQLHDIIQRAVTDLKRDAQFGFGLADDARKDGLGRKLVLGAIGGPLKHMLLSTREPQLPFNDNAAVQLCEDWAAEAATMGLWQFVFCWCRWRMACGVRSISRAQITLQITVLHHRARSSPIATLFWNSPTQRTLYVVY